MKMYFVVNKKKKLYYLKSNVITLVALSHIYIKVIQKHLIFHVLKN